MATICNKTIFFMGQSLELCRHSSPDMRNLSTIAKSSELKELLPLLAIMFPKDLASILRKAADKCNAEIERLAEEAEAKKKSQAFQDVVKPAKRAKLSHVPERILQSVQPFRQTATVKTYSASKPSPRTDTDPPPPYSASREATDHSMRTEPVQDSDVHMQDEERVSDEGVLLPMPSAYSSLSPEPTGGKSACRAEKNDIVPTGNEPFPERESIFVEQSMAPRTSTSPASACDTPAGKNVDSASEKGKGRLEDSNMSHAGTEAALALDHLAENAVNEVRLESLAWKKYETESGITMKVANVIESITDHCLTITFETKRKYKKSKELQVDELLQECEKLDTDMVKDALVRFLNDRIVVPGSKTEAAEMPSTWEMSDPGDIFDALQSIKTNTWDAFIHRAHGQMKLHALIKRQMPKVDRLRSDGMYVEPRKIVIRRLATKKAGPVSEQERRQIEKSYDDEDKAGRRWQQIVDCFGGSGIVIILITAKIGPSKVTREWSNYQCSCLKYISQFLYSIKELVSVLGEDALKKYCRDGCLNRDYIRKVKRVGIYAPTVGSGTVATENESDGDEEDEGEGGDDDYA